jgi:branched-chain amino acid transport system substrate-binding protein
MRRQAAGLGLLIALTSGPSSHADTIRIGIIVSQTGPAASLGIPQRNTVALLPDEISGHHLEYVVLDDASEVTKAVAAVRKLTDEEKVDAVIGPSITPNSLAISNIIAEKRTPNISLASASQIVEPVVGPRRWIFKTPESDSLMAPAMVDHMMKHGIKTVDCCLYRSR